MAMAARPATSPTSTTWSRQSARGGPSRSQRYGLQPRRGPAYLAVQLPTWCARSPAGREGRARAAAPATCAIRSPRWTAPGRRSAMSPALAFAKVRAYLGLVRGSVKHFPSTWRNTSTPTSSSDPARQHLGRAAEPRRRGHRHDSRSARAAPGSGTFFVLAGRRSARPTWCDAIAAGGHEIASHTWSHPWITGSRRPNSVRSLFIEGDPGGSERAAGRRVSGPELLDSPWNGMG
jgi:hypothetical protein